MSKIKWEYEPFILKRNDFGADNLNEVMLSTNLTAITERLGKIAELMETLIHGSGTKYAVSESEKEKND